jgi:predicted DNA-binding transcriptional regulator AlpA
VSAEIHTLAQPVIAGPGIYWSLDRIAAALDVSKRTANKIVSEPGFPDPIELGHPRWVSLEVVDWIENSRKAKVGRPRKAV